MCQMDVACGKYGVANGMGPGKGYYMYIYIYIQSIFNILRQFRR